MSLRDDLNQALEKMSDPEKPPLALDQDGVCSFKLATPGAMASGRPAVMRIDIHLARTGLRFTFSSLLASLAPEPKAPLLAALLNRQFYSNQCDGMSYAINAELNLLLLVYHWVLPGITPDQFQSLFQEFSLAVIDQVAKLGDLSKLDPTSLTFVRPRP